MFIFQNFLGRRDTAKYLVRKVIPGIDYQFKHIAQFRRFTQHSKLELIKKILTGEVRLYDYDYVPNYNIAPTQNVFAVRVSPQDNQKEVVPLYWGLMPSWAKDKKMAAQMINARAETITEKPPFRSAFKSRRCLIPADGFYEWQKDGKTKQPFYIHRMDGKPFMFAGLWELNNQFEEPVESCTIITTSANEIMKPIHERMPVILPEQHFDEWLDLEHDDKDGLQKFNEEIPKRIIKHSNKEETFCFQVAKQILAPYWLLDSLNITKIKNIKTLFNELTHNQKISNIVASRIIFEDYKLAIGIANNWNKIDNEWKIEKGNSASSKTLSKKEKDQLHNKAKKWIIDGKRQDIYETNYNIIGYIYNNSCSAFVLVEKLN